MDIWRDSSRVLDDIVAGGRGRSLGRLLRHQKEVVALVLRHFVINDRAAVDGLDWLRVFEEARVDPLAHNDESDAGKFALLHIIVSHLASLFDGGDLSLLDALSVTGTETIAIDDDLLRKILVQLVVGPV